ncbi:three-Cys-motif partner protein TcmP [Mycolicibacterium neoaurum]|nr:three-Cys-motif partner protein TcmP [Mycolicibacterium neoaurum]MDO3401924.1 three-Cys-motif partner protein TcmP [Mycolicibacterium neoaurum]
MGTPKDTIWKIEPHTQAKHELLTRYLDAWFPILTSWNTKVFYIDGFSGPGTYADGEPGSPLLAIEAARKREAMLKGSTVMFLFNEGHKRRFEELDARLDELIAAGLPDKFEIYTRQGEFADMAQELVNDRADRSFVPTFAFVDPFGWSGVPIDLICKLTRDKRSELFILFSYNSLNRWITEPSQQRNMQELFGCTDYLQAEGKTPAHRKEFLASLYERQLRDIGGFEHVSRFEMIEKNNRTSYFLYHCTRSLKGLEVMRSAMWAIDPQSGRQFSDRVAGLEPLFEGPLTFDLEERLIAAFEGQTVPIGTLQKFVLTDTDYAPAHLKRPTLKPMLEKGYIKVHGDKIRRGTFPDRCEVEFLA